MRLKPAEVIARLEGTPVMLDTAMKAPDHGGVPATALREIRGPES